MRSSLAPRVAEAAHCAGDCQVVSSIREIARVESVAVQVLDVSVADFFQCGVEFGGYEEPDERFSDFCDPAGDCIEDQFPNLFSR